MQQHHVNADRKPIVCLVGHDGNAYNILGLCYRAAQRAGWTPDRIYDVMEDMRASDYNHLLCAAQTYFEVK
jgi:hypothetical protein